MTGLIEVSEDRQAGKWAREIGGRAGPGGLRVAQEDDDDEDLNDEDLDDEDLDDEDDDEDEDEDLVDDEEDAGDEGEEEDPVRTANRMTGVAAPR